MPERWEREVQRIRSVEPSEELWHRVETGPTHPLVPSGPSTRSRVVATLVSAAIVVAVGFGLWKAFGPTRAVGPGSGSHPGSTQPLKHPGPSVYFVALPDTVRAHTGRGDTQLVVTVKVGTNLPDGTLAFVDWTYRGGIEHVAGGLSVSTAVKGGELDVQVPWGVCDFGRGFSLSVEFRPFYEDYTVPGYRPNLPWPPAQPAAVLDLLGARFQLVHGDQVTTVSSTKGPIRQIRVAGRYPWPHTPADFVPPPCASPPPPTP